MITKAAIDDLPNHPPYPEVCNSVIMPNHIHLVIAVGARPATPTPAMEPTPTIPVSSATLFTQNLGCLKPQKHGDECCDYHHNSLLATVVGGLKSAVTRNYPKAMSARQAAPLLPRIWQRLYHEHIIRNQYAFDNIMDYIDSKIVNWDKDCLHQSLH